MTIVDSRNIVDAIVADTVHQIKQLRVNRYETYVKDM